MSNQRRGQPARTPQLVRSVRVRKGAARIESRWKSKLARFVSAYGVARLARGLDVDPSAIYHWIRSATAPRRTHGAIIQRLAREAGVKLTLDQIYQHARDLSAGARESGAPSFPGNVSASMTTASRMRPRNDAAL